METTCKGIDAERELFSAAIAESADVAVIRAHEDACKELGWKLEGQTRELEKLHLRLKAALDKEAAEQMHAARKAAVAAGLRYAAAHQAANDAACDYVESLGVIRNLPGGGLVAAEMPVVVPILMDTSNSGRTGKVSRRFELIDRVMFLLRTVESNLAKDAGGVA